MVGCHGLPIDTGRMLGIPRNARLCLKCNSGLVCDEYHLIFECQTLSQLRAKYCHLFTPPSSIMHQFMWQTDIQAVRFFVRRGPEDPAVLIFSGSFSGYERPPAAHPKYQVCKLLGRLLWVHTSHKAGDSVVVSFVGSVCQQQLQWCLHNAFTDVQTGPVPAGSWLLKL